MRRWEYNKIALNEAPHGRDDIDLLCDAGEEGWGLVTVLPNGIAYLKREIDERVAAEEPASRDEPVVVARLAEGNAAGQEVKPNSAIR